MGRKRRLVVTLSSSGDDSGPEPDASAQPAGRSAQAPMIISSDEDEPKDKSAPAVLSEPEEQTTRRETRSARPRKRLRRKVTITDAPPVVLVDAPGLGQVAVPARLASWLRPHQLEGVRFIWRTVIWDEATDRLRPHEASNGCVLAHCMGLGKTIQLIALSAAVIGAPALGLARLMVLAPVNTLQNWKREVQKWAGQDAEPLFPVFCMDDTGPSNTKRAALLKDWQAAGGMLLIGYEGFRNMVNGKSVRSQEHAELFRQALLEGADMMACDEAHILKNSESALSKAVQQVACTRRVLLTGTPMQNNLMEYHTMVELIRPGLLGSKSEFDKIFVQPIRAGQCKDSSAEQVNKMKQVAHVLHRKLAPIVHRKDYNVLAEMLPQKHEYVISVRLTPLQVQLYRAYLSSQLANAARTSGAGVFGAYHELARVWTHPCLLEGLEKQERDKRAYDSIDDFVVDSSDEEWDGKLRPGQSAVDRGDGKKKPAAAKKEGWWGGLLEEVGLHSGLDQVSGKLVILLMLLDEVAKTGDKMLVFSQSIDVLEAIEQVLESDIGGRWQLGRDYFRIDGSTSTKVRQGWVERFNDKMNARARLFLVSTKAGALGINLVGANRVCLFDAAWNPSYDLQAIFRAYRLTQTKPVYVYRLLAQGTMEEKIYERQVTKQALASRVVDHEQKVRSYTTAELAELFSFDPQTNPSQPGAAGAAGLAGYETSGPPADRVLARVLLQLSPRWICGYHQHDSLLQEDEEAHLSEEEQQAAWQRFEHELQREQQAADHLRQELERQQAERQAAAKRREEASRNPPQHQAFVGPAATLFKVQQAAQQNAQRESLRLAAQLPPNLLGHLGKRVELKGLTKDTTLNGQHGTIVSFDVETSRWSVMLDSQPKRSFRLKGENLQVMMEQQGSASQQAWSRTCQQQGRSYSSAVDPSRAYVQSATWEQQAAQMRAQMEAAAQARARAAAQQRAAAGWRQQVRACEMLGLAGLPGSVSQLKEAFKAAAKRTHPDRNIGDPEAEANFKNVNEAYTQLKLLFMAK